MTKRRLLLIQIDGLSSARLRRAIDGGAVPALAGLSRGGQNLYARRSATPPSTPVFQSALLWGRQAVVHGYTWFDRDTGRVRRMDVPEDIALVEEQLERQATPRRSLFKITRAASYFITYLGGAVRVGFTVAGGLFPSRGFRTAVVARGLWRATGDLPGELARGVLDLARRDGHGREWGFLAMRLLWATYFEEIGVGNAVADMRRGAPLVYINFVAYDETAHRRGPDHPEALRELPRIDRRVSRLLREARRRGYEVMVVSDHGQKASRPFRDVAGRSLAAVVHRACATSPAGGFDALVDELEDQRVRAARGRKWGAPFGLLVAASAAARARRAAWHLERGHGAPAGTIAVVTGGSIAHIYLARRRGGVGLEEIERRFPRVLPALLASPGVGLVVVRKSTRGPRVFWRGEQADLLDEVALRALRPFRDVGIEVLARILRSIAGAVTAGDLVVFGAFARAGAVTFDPELGSHGGIHPEELDLFVIPSEGVTLPPGNVLDPAELSDVIRNWYDQSSSPGRQ